VDFWNSALNAGAGGPDPRNGSFDTYTYWTELDGMLSQHPVADPFFLYLSIHMVHEPYQAPARFQDLYATAPLCPQRKMLQAMVSVVDELVGNLTAKLKATEMWSDTILVFLSDNGGDPTVGGNHPLKGGKATLFEGGVRAASFVYSELLPRAMRGRNLTQPVHVTDLYATFCVRAGLSAEDNQRGVFPIDSVDLWPFISGQNQSAPRDSIVIGHEFRYGQNQTMMGALIKDDWKLIVGVQGYSSFRGTLFPCVVATPAPNCDPHCLYDLSKDPHEHKDLSGEPASAYRLQRLLELYKQEENLFQNIETDVQGFGAAVTRRGGYMGPWTELH
jgi:arylsulfatase B